jgi:hypothetical protein
MTTTTTSDAKPLSSSMTTAEAAVALRAAFKAKGWNARKVSVRTDYYSMGSSIDVTIRDADVKIADVEAIAEQAERIHRCEITGEILGGGNRYIHARYSDDAEKVLRARGLPEIEATVARLATLPQGHGLDIPGTGFALFRGMNGYGFTLYRESSRIAECYDAGDVAYRIATYAPRKGE